MILHSNDVLAFYNGEMRVLLFTKYARNIGSKNIVASGLNFNLAVF